MFRLSTLSVEDYVREVLPHSASLWSGDRSFEEYVDDFRTLTASGFGRRRFRTLGLTIDGRIVTSCKRYAREVRCGDRTFRAAGIGAVYTPDDLRGRGYATALLGALLDAERSLGTDIAFLFSDIHPAFYERLGFVRLPARTIVLRADALPSHRMTVRALDVNDWPGIERCFAATDERRAFSLTRPPLVWEWMREKTRAREATGSLVRLGVMRGRRLAAYVIGRRFPATDSFALDEFAYVDDAASELVPALVRNAAGDLRKVTGWLPPAPAREMLPRGAARKRTTGITMTIALSTGARAALARSIEGIERGTADPCWNADHV